jgi:hypothetical protein
MSILYSLLAPRLSGGWLLPLKHFHNYNHEKGLGKKPNKIFEKIVDKKIESILQHEHKRIPD